MVQLYTHTSILTRWCRTPLLGKLWGSIENIKLSRKIFTFFFFLLVILTGNAQTITFSSSNPAIPNANLGVPSTKKPIYRTVVSFSGAGRNLNTVTFTPTGTFDIDDIGNYEVWYNTSDNLAGASKSQNADAATFGGSGDQVTINLNNPWFNNNTTYYFWITVDISSIANTDAGHTIIVNALTPSNFTFNGNSTKTGTMYVGGTQTIIATGPNIIRSPSSLMGFNYIVDNGPSTPLSYSVSGTSLTANIVITAPTNYEISTSGGSGYANSITLTQSGGVVAATTIYVRLKSGLAIGTYNSQNITHSSAGATTKNVTCSGVVNCNLSPPTVSSPIYYCQNATPAQLTATGSNLSWETYGTSSVGGTTNPTQNTGNNGAITYFTVNSTVSSVTIQSVDFGVRPYQSVTNFVVAIQNSDGSPITNGTQSNPAISYSSSGLFQKLTSTFSNLILTPGNYRIVKTSGSGNVGYFNGPSYPMTESTGSINITGHNQNLLYYNLQFAYVKSSATAPTPVTDFVGTTNYYVTQTASGCTSGPATIQVVITNDCPKRFRSIASGNWDATSTWQQSTDGGVTWGTANSTPLSTDIATVQSGNTVTLTANATVSTLTINGTIDVGAFALVGSDILTLSSMGTMLVGGTSNFPSGFSTVTLNTGCTINYNRNGAQTVSSLTYSHISLSGTGAKTITGITVNGILSVEGSATTTGSAPTYGSNATLRYNGNTVQTTGAEFSATFNGSGGVIIDNPNGLTLNAAKTIGAASKLTFVNGTLTTTSTNLITINNTSNTAVTGSGVSAFVNGPIRWAIGTGNYLFPVGKGANNYLPFTLNTSATANPIVTIEGFDSDVGGGVTYDATLSSISHTEYWKADLNSGTFTGKVSLTRTTALTTEDLIAKSTLQAGSYTAIGGTASSPSIVNSDDISTFSYFVMARSNKDCPISTAITPSSDQTVCQGTATNQLTATITTSGGTGNPTLNYQWYYNTTNSNTVTGATKITGATNQTYTPLSGISESGTTRYYFCVGFTTNNGCSQTDTDQSLASASVKVKVTNIEATVSLLSSSNICPETDTNQGFNPDNSAYNAGATRVVFRVSRPANTVDWRFEYQIEDATVRTNIDDPSPYPQQSSSPIEVDGSLDYFDLTFYIDNEPGTPLTPLLKISSIADDNGCSGTTTPTADVDIKAMPMVGSFN